MTNEAGATFVPDLPDDDAASDKEEEESAAKKMSDRDSSDSAVEDESDGDGEEETPAMKALRQLGRNSMHLENIHLLKPTVCKHISLSNLTVVTIFEKKFTGWPICSRTRLY